MNKPLRLLLVDDDAFLRDMYATKFTEAGHTVKVAENGEACLALLEKEEVDVILLDMVMPGITGIDLLKKIFEQKPNTMMKCIVLSNQGEEKDKDAAKAAGAVGYIVKAEAIPSEVVNRVEVLAT